MPSRDLCSVGDWRSQGPQWVLDLPVIQLQVHLRVVLFKASVFLCTQSQVHLVGPTVREHQWPVRLGGLVKIS